MSPADRDRLRHWLKEAMKQRRAHKQRARVAQQRFDEDPRRETHLALLVAQERSRGSRIRARRLHEEYQAPNSPRDPKRCYGTGIRKVDPYSAGDHCYGCEDCSRAS